MAPSTVSLTGNRVRGDDNKHDENCTVNFANIGKNSSSNIQGYCGWPRSFCIGASADGLFADWRSIVTFANLVNDFCLFMP